jgi:hypothetical protein
LDNQDGKEELMEFSEELDKLYKALDGFQAKSPLVKATKENPYHKNKYADYNAVVVETRSDLAENGLRVKQATTHIDGKTAIYTRLTHLESKQFIASTTPVAHKESDPQSEGSGITYVKRYAYVAMLDLLVDADDDGNLGSELGKAAERNQQVENAISLIEKTTSEEELKKLFVNLPPNMKTDKRVIASKDEKKKELPTS